MNFIKWLTTKAGDSLPHKIQFCFASYRNLLIDLLFLILFHLSNDWFNYTGTAVVETMLGSGDSSYIIKLRGLPFKTTVEDVLDFLGPVNVVNGKEGKL